MSECELLIFLKCHLCKLYLKGQNIAIRYKILRKQKLPRLEEIVGKYKWYGSLYFPKDSSEGFDFCEVIHKSNSP